MAPTIRDKILALRMYPDLITRCTICFFNIGMNNVGMPFMDSHIITVQCNPPALDLGRK